MLNLIRLHFLLAALVSTYLGFRESLQKLLLFQMLEYFDSGLEQNDHYNMKPFRSLLTELSLPLGCLCYGCDHEFLSCYLVFSTVFFLQKLFISSSDRITLKKLFICHLEKLKYLLLSLLFTNISALALFSLLAPVCLALNSCLAYFLGKLFRVQL